jgi:ATP-binding protein involved in chromosome partitioning
MSTPSQPLLVRRIAQLDRYTLGIEWVDGHRSQWRLASLRRNCPCASCRDEITGQRTLAVEKVDEDLLATEVESVGRYALRVRFADGHDTGIYTLRTLRELCECDACKAARAPRRF